VAPSRIDARLNREIEAIVLRALARDPDDRYASIQALGDDLRRYLAGEPVTAHPQGPLYVLGKLARRHRTATTLTCAAVVVICGLAIVAGLSARDAWHSQAAEQQARQTAEHAERAQREARDVAERVSAFLGDTLASARPARGGAKVTLLEMLDDAGRRAFEQLADQPRVAAEVHHEIARTYRSLWKWREARPHAEAALNYARSIYPNDDERLAEAMTALGSALTSLRDPESVALQRGALAMRRRLYDGDHPLIAESLTKLSYALHQGQSPPDWDEAEHCIEAALAMYRRTLGWDHRDVASCLHNYGWMRYRQMRTADAARLYGEALDVLRRIDARDDPFYTECLNGYSGLLSFLKRPEDCLAALDEAIPPTRDDYGDEALAPLIRRRGNMLRMVGRHADARAAILEACALHLDVDVAPSPESARDVRETRAACLAAGTASVPPGSGFAGLTERIVLAAASLEQSDREMLLILLLDLARIDLEDDRAQEAEATIERTLALCAGEAGRPDPTRAEGLELLARVYRATGRSDVALRFARRSLDMIRNTSAGTPWRWESPRGLIGELLTELGRIDEARPILIEHVAGCERAFGEGHPDTVAARARLAALSS
jgi:tetratricopeptide (TPR) repeat protein